MPIPKVIHYCWFGDGPKTDLVLHCIDSWKKYAPHCNIVEWNESNYDITKNLYMNQAYKAKRWGFVPDYARLDLVYRYGGIYFDTDVELIRSIDELFTGNGFMGFEQANHRGVYYVNTGSGFGANKNDSVIESLLEEYESLSFYKRDGSENLQPSPFYNSNALKRIGLRLDNSYQTIGDITVFPYDFFCPVNWKTHKCVITENTYSIHHFDASWLTKQEKLRRKRERYLDYIIHTPNRAVMSLLGEERYKDLKKRMKKND